MQSKRRLPRVAALGLALIASLALGGMVAASASATTQHWYSCQEVAASTGGFTDSACQKLGKGNYEWGKVGTSASYSLQNSGPIKLITTISGLQLVVECNEAKASGTLGNPAGGGAGTLNAEGASSLLLSSCYDEAPGCKVKEGKIAFNSLKGEATEVEGKAALNLDNAGETPLASVTIEGCTGSYAPHNGTRKLMGDLNGISNASSSSLEFTKTSSTPMLGASPASFVGTTAVHTASGAALRVGISPPLNTALPTISSSTPKVGTSVSATTGSWTYTPSSYSYAWKRCDEIGNCWGAGSKSTYTPTADDAGYALVVDVTATNEGGSTKASSIPTGQVAGSVPSWYACQKGLSASMFTDSACTKAGGEGEYSWLKLASPTGFAMSALTGLTLKLPIITSVTVTCSSLSAGGTLENHAGSAGTASLNEPGITTLGGCTVTEPAGQGCTVEGGTIQMASLVGEITEVGGQPAVKLSSSSGGTLFTLYLSGCSVPALNGPKPVEGSLTGIWNGAARALEFTSSSSNLTYGSKKGSFVGNAKLETSGGQQLKVVR